MQINFLAVILAALSAFFLGYFWYTIIFAKPWQKEIGLKMEDATAAPNLGRQLVLSFILELIMAFTLANLIGKEADAITGLTKGAVIGAAFVAAAFGVNYLFEGKTLKHWMINAAYNVLVFAVMGLIIGLL